MGEEQTGYGRGKLVTKEAISWSRMMTCHTAQCAKVDNLLIYLRILPVCHMPSELNVTVVRKEGATYHTCSPTVTSMQKNPSYLVHCNMPNNYCRNIHIHWFSCPATRGQWPWWGMLSDWADTTAQTMTEIASSNSTFMYTFTPHCISLSFVCLSEYFQRHNHVNTF